LLAGEGRDWFEQRVLLAYCGRPHESRDINSRWIAQFLTGATRPAWAEIVDCTKGFVDAIKKGDAAGAVDRMNREGAIRMQMTPDVLDDLGRRLTEDAAETGCGARFTGAGGGGCLWAFGRQTDIARLKPAWSARTETVTSALLLDFTVDTQGVIVHI